MARKRAEILGNIFPVKNQSFRIENPTIADSRLQISNSGRLETLKGSNLE